MTYVIALPCVDVKDRACIDECPVDCIYEGERSLYIHPDECVDCGACEPVCPVEAIYYEDDLPDVWADYYKANVEFFDEVGSPGGAAKVGRAQLRPPGRGGAAAAGRARLSSASGSARRRRAHARWRPPLPGDAGATAPPPVKSNAAARAASPYAAISAAGMPNSTPARLASGGTSWRAMMR